MSHLRLAFAVLSILLVVACAPTLPTSLPTPVHTSTISVIPTYTPSLRTTEPVATGIPVQRSSPTPLPTSIKATAAFTETPEPIEETDPFAPPSPNPTALALQKEWKTYPVLFAPNGKWAAPSNSSHSEADDAVIVIRNIVTDNRRTVSCKLFLPSCDSIEAIHWSKDSRYLYLAASGQYGETSPGQPLMSELARLDVESGKFEKLAGNLSATKRYDDSYSSPDDYDFSISLDDQYFAYVKSSYMDDQDTVEFAILTTDKRKEVEKRTLNLASAGDLTWSPSNNYLVFQTVGPSGQGIAFYDLNSKTLRYVIQNETNDSLSIHGWDVRRNLVMLVKMSWNDRLSSYWYLNPFTSEILPIPNPTATTQPLSSGS